MKIKFALIAKLDDNFNLCETVIRFAETILRFGLQLFQKDFKYLLNV